MLFSFAAHAAIVDGDPKFNLATDKGLYVWRTSSGDWQVRLLAGSTSSQSFSGALESSKAISNLKQIALQDSDTATLSSNTLLNIEFFTRSGAADGVKFTTAGGVGLCLWDANTAGTTVYLGKNRTARTTPVDLLGNGACDGTSPIQSTSSGGTSGGGTTTPPPSGAKYHPGHYTRLLRGNDSQATMAASIKPGVRGFVKHYSWKSLEPSQGSYNFSEIQSDLNYVASVGMQLIVLIEDKTFANNEKPTPAYLQGSSYVRPNRPGGYTTIRWNPTVVTRYKALVKAIAQRFDSNPNFEGMSNQETAPGLDKVHLDATGYTAAKYRDALIAMVSAAADNMSQSSYFLFINFMPGNQGYLEDVATAVQNKGVVLGSPDVRPDDPPLIQRVYPILNNFIGKMHLFNQVEGSCYKWLHEDTSYPTKYWTMPELYNFAVDQKNGLGVDYLFWSRIPNASPSNSYDWYDALKVMANHPVW